MTDQVKVIVSVREDSSNAPIAQAQVSLRGRTRGKESARGRGYAKCVTNANGVCELEFTPKETQEYELIVSAFGAEVTEPLSIHEGDEIVEVEITFDFGLEVRVLTEDFSTAIDYCTAGDVVGLEAYFAPVSGPPGEAQENQQYTGNILFSWTVSDGSLLELPENQAQSRVRWDTAGVPGNQTAIVTIADPRGASVSHFGELIVREGSFLTQIRKTRSIPVSLRRTERDETADQALWVAIRNRTKAIGFSSPGYKDFVDAVLCLRDANTLGRFTNRRGRELYTPIHGVGAYELLKTATEIFLLIESGVVIEGTDRYTNQPLYVPGEEVSRLGRFMSLIEVQDKLQDYLGDTRLPYIRRVLDTAFAGRQEAGNIFCPGFLGERADRPLLLELIWSYWHEEGMLVQTMKTISLRFQNRRRSPGHDPLAHLEIAPLFPINNLLWGYIQDEQHRLSVPRRAYEYNHHYGLTLAGKAVSDFQPADSRSKFLEGFHNLLFLTTLFYKQDDDVTIAADAFPLLNALREVHLLLAEGAHNQFGDLPWTARVEMLIEQWILSRPEMRDFLQTRAMIPYREEWMPAVDTMKKLQGWTDVSVNHFNELALYGEQILLSIRYGDWIEVADPDQAANWARYWRPEVQNYIHSYRAATGVDLRAEVTTDQQRALITTQPSILMRQRLPGSTQPVPALPAGNPVAGELPSFRMRRAARRQQ